MVNKISKRRISSWISIGCFILVRSLDQSVLLVGQMRSAVFAPPGNTQMDICSLNTRLEEQPSCHFDFLLSTESPLRHLIKMMRRYDLNNKRKIRRHLSTVRNSDGKKLKSEYGPFLMNINH